MKNYQMFPGCSLRVAAYSHRWNWCENERSGDFSFAVKIFADFRNFLINHNSSLRWEAARGKKMCRSSARIDKKWILWGRRWGETGWKTIERFRISQYLFQKFISNSSLKLRYIRSFFLAFHSRYLSFTSASFNFQSLPALNVLKSVRVN